MATTVTATAKSVSASALKAAVTHAALLNSSGTECTSSGYARQAISWGTVTDGVVSFTGTLSFTVSSFTVGKIAGYTAVTSGTQYLVDDVTPAVFTTAGTYTVDSGSLTIADPA